MKNPKRSDYLLLAALAICFLLVPPAAWAYLDPSTGSMVVSAIVGIFASIALALKTYWYKIKTFLNRNDKKASDSRDASE